MPAKLEDVTLAILAGGEGSRMGMPKSQLVIHDKPILAYLMERFAWPGPTLLVTALGRDPVAGSHAFTNIASDKVSGEGPLRGVLTALESSRTEITIVTTVDMPCVTQANLSWLVRHLNLAAQLQGVLLTRIRGGKPAIEPFPSAFRKGCENVIRQRLEANCRSVLKLEDEPTISLLQSPAAWPAETWTNLNHRAEYEEFLRGIHRGE